jgi:molybdopterin-guanine dinucleotide biosynthesis protein A
MTYLNDQSSIACAILAGGQSRRMGCHKAFLQYRGKVFIDIVRENMQTWFHDIFIVTNDKALFHNSHIPVYEDIIKNKGPLGALYTALSVAKKEYVFCVACDMPYPNNCLIFRMLQANLGNAYDCLVPRGPKGLEPLFALYRTSVIDLVKEELTSIKLKITGIYPKCRTHFVDLRCEGHEIVNINTPADYLHFAVELSKAV